MHGGSSAFYDAENAIVQIMWENIFRKRKLVCGNLLIVKWLQNEIKCRKWFRCMCVRLNNKMFMCLWSERNEWRNDWAQNLNGKIQLFWLIVCISVVRLLCGLLYFRQCVFSNEILNFTVKIPQNMHQMSFLDLRKVLAFEGETKDSIFIFTGTE